MYKVIVQYKGKEEELKGRCSISLVNKKDEEYNEIFQFGLNKTEKIMEFSSLGSKHMRTRIPMNEIDMPNFEINWNAKSEMTYLKYISE